MTPAMGSGSCGSVLRATNDYRLRCDSFQKLTVRTYVSWGMDDGAGRTHTVPPRFRHLFVAHRSFLF